MKLITVQIVHVHNPKKKKTNKKKRFVIIQTFQLYSSSNILESITIGVGYTILEMIALVEPLDAVVVHGICQDVGIGGHFSTSAFGWLSTVYGMGIDRVLSFRLALSNGTIVTVSNNTYSDLFFGVIGGAV